MAFKKNMPGCSAGGGCSCTIDNFDLGGSWVYGGGQQTDMWFGHDCEVVWNTFIRFLGVDVEQGATIVSAKITVRGPNVPPSYQDDDCNVTIIGVDKDDADILIDGVDDFETYFSAVDRTTATVDWNAIVDFNSLAVPNSYDTPDITAIVQEIVNRPGWVSGNAMMIFFEDNASDVCAFRVARQGGTTNPSLVITV